MLINYLMPSNYNCYAVFDSKGVYLRRSQKGKGNFSAKSELLGKNFRPLMLVDHFVSKLAKICTYVFWCLNLGLTTCLDFNNLLLVQNS